MLTNQRILDFSGTPSSFQVCSKHLSHVIRAITFLAFDNDYYNNESKLDFVKLPIEEALVFLRVTDLTLTIMLPGTFAKSGSAHYSRWADIYCLPSFRPQSRECRVPK